MRYVVRVASERTTLMSDDAMNGELVEYSEGLVVVWASSVEEARFQAGLEVAKRTEPIILRFILSVEPVSDALSDACDKERKAFPIHHAKGKKGT